MMNDYGSPENFWEERLTHNFDLTGVGYESLGSIYNGFLYHARYKSLFRAIDRCGITFENKRVLELGPGTGFYTEIFQQKHVDVYTGIDITKISVENLAKRFPEYQFIKADISEDSLPLDDQWDIILAADVLYHIVDDERFQKTINRVGRLLKPGGYLIVADVFTKESEQPSSHVRLRGLQEYKDSLSSQSIYIIHIEPIFALLHPPAQIANTSYLWKFYSKLWRVGLSRLIRFKGFDLITPKVFSYLDEHYFLTNYGLSAPNNKWLIAQKKYVD